MKETKVCTRCNVEHDIENFPIRTSNKKPKSICRTCVRIEQAPIVADIPDLEGEIWTSTHLFPKIFLVSTKGRTKRIRYRTHPCQKLIQPYITNGYRRINFTVNGKITKCSLHRLVAIAFISNPLNLPEVNHDDGNKGNNCVENLIWSTSSDNVKHAYDTGLMVSVKGENHGRSKLKNEEVLEIVRLHETMSRKSLAAMFNVGLGAINKIFNGSRWGHLTGIKKASK